MWIGVAILAFVIIVAVFISISPASHSETAKTPPVAAQDARALNHEASPIQNPNAKRYALDVGEYYDSDNQAALRMRLVDRILADPQLPNAKHLTIGFWGSDGPQWLIKPLAANPEKIAQVEELFWGDIESEEQEISWIVQGDLSPLLDALPHLSKLTIRGANGLKLGTKPHPRLRSLEIISGGLPASVVREIAASEFPNLEKLVLYVGIEEYGFSGKIEDFKPFFSRKKFPKLKYLGIVNAEEQDKIVEWALASDLLPQLETLDLSCGVLTDRGGQLLLDNADKIRHLKFIDMRYNYLGKAMREKLTKLSVKTDVSEAQEFEEDDDELRGDPMLTE
jgi:hypothetical protein